MKAWQEDLLKITETDGTDQEIFLQIAKVSKSIGFDYCAYGLRLPWPLTNPKIFMVNNYPLAWQRLYTSAGYLQIDPVVLHGCKSQKPLIWTDSVFSESRQLWEDAQAHGITVGWSQSSLQVNGVGGMLSLSRPNDPLNTTELEAQERQMCWLVSIAHLSMSRVLIEKEKQTQAVVLTSREIEILKWSGDGKSSQDIADILNLTKHTVDFHIKNSINKLFASNKTSAVVKAIMLGILK